jgi:hypothetical protein
MRACFTLTVVGKAAMDKWAMRGQRNIHRKATLGSLIRRQTRNPDIVLYR